MSRPPRRRFDARYYARFYGDEERGVEDPAQRRRLVRFVLAYLDFLGVEVGEVLDLGCGLGAWGRHLAELAPSVRYRGVERSAYACRRGGFEQGSVVDYPGPGADLVVCQGVLQYLVDEEAAAAIDNLGRLARGALYLEVLTRRDWLEVCDRRRTDGRVHLRPEAWYRTRLERHFVPVGGGLFLPQEAAEGLYALEKCPTQG